MVDTPDPSAFIDGLEPPDQDLDDALAELLGDAPRPIDWSTLSAEDAEAEWLELNRWVDWLRHEYGLPATIVPPLWHRHPELLWELSALHLAWVASYDPQQSATAPLTWHRDFHAARERLRDWVAIAGTKLDRDRPTRQTVWPGEEAGPDTEEIPIANRDEDFIAFVRADVRARASGPDGAGV
ncbi:MAG: hypothetical protein J0H23_11395 [Micrococcales bacterium]|nr:hypothetical protein [Micrococcales bacterium]OJX69434.1 MAG: hypothetical protein BGO94_13025 [Micrococcales bacterium 72-143]